MRNTRRPARRGSRSPGAGTSGSRKARLSWTGPGGVSSKAPVAAASAVSTARSGLLPAGTSAAKRTCSPNRSSWMVVWLAPVPRSSSGRSAETTTSGTAAWLASITAGRRFPTAVPEVVRTAAGAPGGQGQAQGGEAGGALVDPDQQLHPPGGVGLGQGVGHRRGARPRRHHHVADAAVEQQAATAIRAASSALSSSAPSSSEKLTCSPASRCRAGPVPRTAGAAPGRTGPAAIPGPSPRTSAPGTGRRRT